MSAIDKPCTGCGWPMRKGTTPVADAPGTRSYGAYGKCNGCAQKIQRAKKPKVLPLLNPIERAEALFATRLIERLFPGEPRLLEMLGIS